MFYYKKCGKHEAVTTQRAVICLQTSLPAANSISVIPGWLVNHSAQHRATSPTPTDKPSALREHRAVTSLIQTFIKR